MVSILSIGASTARAGIFDWLWKRPSRQAEAKAASSQERLDVLRTQIEQRGIDPAPIDARISGKNFARGNNLFPYVQGQPRHPVSASGESHRDDINVTAADRNMPPLAPPPVRENRVGRGLERAEAVGLERARSRVAGFMPPKVPHERKKLTVTPGRVRAAQRIGRGVRK
jgi:hypothetical protein